MRDRGSDHRTTEMLSTDRAAAHSLFARSTHLPSDRLVDWQALLANDLALKVFMNRKFVPMWALVFASALATAQSITLDEALVKARENRASIQSAKLSVEEAKFSRRALGALPATRLGLGLSSPKTLGATDEDLFLEQPIDLFGRARASRALGQAQVLLAESGLQSVRLGVQGDVLEKFARAEAAQATLNVALKLADLADQLFKATTRRFEEGKIPQIQVRRAEIELSRASQRRSLAQATFLSALKMLAGAVGADALEGVSGAFEVPVVVETDFSGRPDLMALNSERADAMARGNVADRSRLPELSLVGLRSPWEDRRGEFGARVQLSWAVWDDGRARSEKRAAQTKDQAAQAGIEDVRRKATAELSAIDTELVAAQNQVASFQTLIEETRALVDLAQKGFREGVGTQIDVLEASRSLREIEEEAVEARLRVNLLIAQRLSVSGYVLEAIR